MREPERPRDGKRRDGKDGPARYPGQAAIEAYGNGGFRFAGMSHKGSILCLPDAIEALDVVSVEELTVGDLAPLLLRMTELDIVLLGAGVEHRRPSEQVRQAFAEAGVSFDVMTTGAAARTWNVLIAEGRRTAAVLIATE